ncbi:Serine/threonine-protein phosphatase 7 long form homolog [Linum perenne]
MLCLIVWQPYEDETIFRALRRSQGSINVTWDARVPLICFHIVEWHLPDRVMRQFSFHQHIPISVPSGMHELHRIDLRRGEENWSSYHDQYIQIWNVRQTLRINGNPMRAFQAQGYHDEYMQWYRRITRLWVSQSGGMFGAVVGFLYTHPIRLTIIITTLTSVVNILLGQWD